MMKNKWRQEELDALEKEMIEHGTNWKTILLFDGLPDGPLKNRKNTQLKDKQGMKKKKRKKGIPLDIFEKAIR